MPDSISRLHHQRAAAGGVQVGGDEAARRLEIGDERRPRADAIEIGQRQLDARFPRDRQQVQHGVGRSAGRRDDGDRVLDRLPRDDVARPAGRASPA